MTWIKTVTMEDDERVKKAMLAQRSVYPIEYATPEHRGVALADPGCSLSCLQHLRDVDVSGAALTAPPARDDCDHGFRHEPVRLLNRIPRRVSASRDFGQRAGGGASDGLPVGPNQRAGSHHARLRCEADQRCDPRFAGRSRQP